MTSADLAAPALARPRGRRRPRLAAGLAMLLALLAAGLLGPLLSPYDPARADLARRCCRRARSTGSAPTISAATCSPACSSAGASTCRSPSSASPCRSSSAPCSGPSPAISAAWTDALLMRLVDVLWAFPFYVLVIAIVGMLGPCMANIYLAFTLVVWISFARIVRGEVLVVQRARIRHGRAPARLQPCPDHPAPRPAQRDHAGHRLRHGRLRAHHPRLSRRSASSGSASSRRRRNGGS